jgi:hypothetical protein
LLDNHGFPASTENAGRGFHRTTLCAVQHSCVGSKCIPGCVPLPRIPKSKGRYNRNPLSFIYLDHVNRQLVK